jgi:hypothetical protein
LCLLSDLFRFDIDPNDPDSFFTNAERSLIVREALDRTVFTPEGSSESRFGLLTKTPTQNLSNLRYFLKFTGIFKLLIEGVYLSSFPLHEVKNRQFYFYSVKRMRCMFC